jgi:hypothetical protein
MQWSYRLPRLLSELRLLEADIVCLQECELKTFEQDFAKPLSDVYSAVIQNDKARREGHPVANAVLFKKHKFEASHVDSRSRTVIVELKSVANIAKPQTTAETAAAAGAADGNATASAAATASPAASTDAKATAVAAQPQYMYAGNRASFLCSPPSSRRCCCHLTTVLLCRCAVLAVRCMRCIVRCSVGW